MALSIESKVASILFVFGLHFAVGCHPPDDPTAVIFLNHSGRELEGEISIRGEGTRFAPLCCTIFVTEFRKGDLIETELTDVFTLESLRNEVRLPSSRDPVANNQSLYISIQPGGRIDAQWYDLSHTDNALDAAAMHRLHKCLPIAVQPNFPRGVGKVRIHQPNFKYICTPLPDRTSSYGYLTTNSKATTNILATYKDEQGPITKFASIPDEMLQQWISQGTTGISVWIDVETDQATVYPVKDADRDAYVLSKQSRDGSIKHLGEPIRLPLQQSREDFVKIFAAQ